MKNRVKEREGESPPFLFLPFAAGGGIGQVMAGDLPIDLDAFDAAPLTREPFAFAMVPRFVRAEAMAAINADYPLVTHPGSFPLPTLQYGPAFRDFITAIQGLDFTRAVEKKFGTDLKGRPTMVTARGISAARDGQIHTDSRTKLLTVLIYMNNAWEAKTGRLRLLRGPHDLDDVIAEVPPDEGTMLIFRNGPNAWHGFHTFVGPRRVIQLNWVTDMGVVKREQTRHKISAFFKRLGGRGTPSHRM
jgi:SM-20-related protein